MSRDRDAIPTRLNSVWTQMPFLRGRQGQERLVELRALTREAREIATRRRDAALAHPWARRKLCEIMGYQRAEQWTGYVPPRSQAAGKVYPGSQFNKQYEEAELLANDSPTRQALIGLLREVDAYNREAAGSGANQDDQA